MAGLVLLFIAVVAIIFGVIWAIITLSNVSNEQKRISVMLKTMQFQLSDLIHKQERAHKQELEKKMQQEDVAPAKSMSPAQDISVKEAPSKATIENKRTKAHMAAQSETTKATPESQINNQKEPAKREASAFEKRATDILNKIWNWIVVGEEFRNPSISMEYAVASAWLLRSAIIIRLFTRIHG